MRESQRPHQCPGTLAGGTHTAHGNTHGWCVLQLKVQCKEAGDNSRQASALNTCVGAGLPFLGFVCGSHSPESDGGHCCYCSHFTGGETEAQAD